MKKRIVTMCLFMCIVLVMGCGDKDNSRQSEVMNSTEIANETETAVTENDAEVTVDGEMPEAPNAIGRIVYAGENLRWEEVRIIIPQAWDDRYVVKEDANGVSFYQKASNEKEESMGFICGIYRSGQYSDSGAGEELVAYTDEGMVYYVLEPTDVTCYAEDETILNEYDEMMQYVDWIAGSIEIVAENVHYDVKQYEIPTSSILPLEAYHVANLTNNELWIARNEIYARHGKVFQNEYLAAYFESCSWYEAKEGKSEITERELNEVEIANLKLIVAAEETYAKEHPYPKQYTVGEEIEAALYDSKEKQRICYEVIAEDDWEYRCVLTINDKTYELKDYVNMTTPIEDVFYLTDIAYYDNKLEIAVMDNGPSDDPVTYFFQYDGKLHYVGEVQGFPFEDYGNNFFDGFNGQNSVIGTSQVNLIESAFVRTYYWYNAKEGTLEKLERVKSNYVWPDGHELYVDIPVYYSKDKNAPLLMLQAGEMVYFISTDCKEWILVRSASGVEGYIHVEGGKILNIGLPAEEVFAELYFFG